MPKIKYIGHKPSSRKRKQKVQEDDVPNLADQYGALFPIYSAVEGARYKSLTTNKRPFVYCKNLDLPELEKIGMASKITSLIAQLGLEKFIAMNHDSYDPLTLEFFTTLKFSSPSAKDFKCRMMGIEYEVDYEVMFRVFGFSKGGLTDSHKNFDADAFWRQITPLRTFDSHRASNGFLQDHCYLILHKFLCHAIFGKRESNKVSLHELFFLWCLHTNCKVSITYSVFQSLLYVINHKKTPISLGHMVLGLALFFRALNPPLTSLNVKSCGNITYNTLRRVEIIWPNWEL